MTFTVLNLDGSVSAFDVDESKIPEIKPEPPTPTLEERLTALELLQLSQMGVNPSV